MLYTHDSVRGVVPYNTGLLRHGVLHALVLAQSVEEAEELGRDLVQVVSA
jgi:hypothetical protein